MAKTFSPNEIPNIWASQIWQVSIKNVDKPDVSIFDNAPNDISVWSFFGKIFIGVVIWICVAALLFGVLTAFWWMSGNDNGQVNPILGILLPVVWFIVTFVWNLVLALMYSMFFSKRYYNFGKMFWLIFVSSLILLVFFFIIYALYSDINELYLILWLQIAFSLYISLNLMDFLSQPNYSASSLMWNTLWCVLAVVAHLWIMNVMVKWWSNSQDVIMPTIISSVITYGVMILGAWIWDALYYKFYEWWNNPFYLPSLNELREERQKEESKKEKEDEEVNVEIK